MSRAMTGSITVTSNKRARSDEDHVLLRTIGVKLTRLRTATLPPMSRVNMVGALKEKYGSLPGLNTSSISAAEKGQRAISPYIMMCLANFFNKPLSWFFGNEILARERNIIFGSDNKYLLQIDLNHLKIGTVLSIVEQDTLSTGYYIIHTELDVTAVHIYKRLDNEIEVFDGISKTCMNVKEFEKWQSTMTKSSRVTHATFEL
jgi:hypothetical protein